MKVSHIGSGFLVVTLSILFFVSSKAFSENRSSPQMGSTTHSITVESNHPLAMAHQELKQAHDDFNKGNIGAVQKDLDAASKWLQNSKISNNPKTRDEAAKLANEIQTLHKQLIHPSDKHESALARLWHRSTALVEHEVQHITKSWKDSSTANRTLKRLMDARLHFNYAEHELFRSNDVEQANEELNKTVAYLDKASEVATPRVREKIATIKKDIQRLPTSPANTNDEQMTIQALEKASISIDKASNSVSLEIQARSKKIALEIRNLKKDVTMLERRQQYNSMMERLRQLDKIL